MVPSQETLIPTLGVFKLPIFAFTLSPTSPSTAMLRSKSKKAGNGGRLENSADDTDEEEDENDDKESEVEGAKEKSNLLPVEDNAKSSRVGEKRHGLAPLLDHVVKEFPPASRARVRVARAMMLRPTCPTQSENSRITSHRCTTNTMQKPRHPQERVEEERACDDAILPTKSISDIRNQKFLESPRRFISKLKPYRPRFTLYITTHSHNETNLREFELLLYNAYNPSLVFYSSQKNRLSSDSFSCSSFELTFEFSDS
ncbi:uncharacterized protein G2W53_021744 [Senna tora]|uniref:Uncharacterized protein n=1 Tax=Senna tora TaxID=362788 RepID=A0A834TMP6_9FABA|nr:uncharacterized protein G2W53_021744 [Senna tora]